jgi:Glycosyl transferase family 90
MSNGNVMLVSTKRLKNAITLLVPLGLAIMTLSLGPFSSSITEPSFRYDINTNKITGSITIVSDNSNNQEIPFASIEILKGNEELKVHEQDENVEEKKDDTDTSKEELFHVRHPSTGEYVIGRYGKNYTNRSERFPSITERVMLYMSNWYLPACHRDDISGIRYYTTPITTGTKSTMIRRLNEGSNNNNNNNNNNMNSVDNTNKVSTHYVTVSSYNEKPTESEDGHNVSELFVKNRFIKWNFTNTVKADTIFYLDKENVINAANVSNLLLASYSIDVQNTIMTTMQRLQWYNSSSNKQIEQVPSPPPPPVLIQYGDLTYCVVHIDNFYDVNTVPVIKKFRNAIVSDEERVQIALNDNNVSTSSSQPVVQCTSSIRQYPKNTVHGTWQPIIWKLNTERHYQRITSGEIDNWDTVPYEDKYNIAIFRGAMSGARDSVSKWEQYISERETNTFSNNITDFEICYNVIRCRFVMMYSNDTSPNIDAKIPYGEYTFQHPWSITVPDNYNYSNNFPTPTSFTVLNNTLSTIPTRVVHIGSEPMPIELLLKYKMLIILEGNDVSSALKWALYSSCVVIMPYPVTVTSWAMEELLEPYIHFVPIKPDLTDVHDAVQWILAHEQETKHISKRATQWMKDLLYYPEEEQIIQDEILQRYRSNFFHYNDE